jgi:hypothetical protein
MGSFGGILRYLAYALMVTAAAGLVLWVGIYSPDGLRMSVLAAPGHEPSTSEFSLVEYMQSVLLVACIAIFAWIAARDRLRRPLAIGFAALFLLFLVREQDYFLDHYGADNLWQVLASLVLALASVYLYRHRHRLELGWRRSWPSAGLAILISGLIILIPFSQIVGDRGLWMAILGDSYVRTARLAGEELMELSGYLVITIGSLEFLYAWSRLPHTRTIDRPRRRPAQKRA